jgi:hypothetical protein
MDKQSQEMFDKLMRLDIDALNESELAFLIARRSYMNEVERARYSVAIKAHEDSLDTEPKAPKEPKAKK